jgi:cytochrome c oxidase assembly factor CtaG
VAALAAFALVHARGWRRLALPPARLGATAAGLGALLLAIASPLDALAGWLLIAHMVQHLLLLVVAPPLLLFGLPGRALLAGLPRAFVREGLAPILGSRAFRGLERALHRPLWGVALLTLTTWAWHLPRAYELALRVPVWHRVEHACFFGAALWFWWPVMRARNPRWLIVPCLLLADLQNTALSALLVFSDQVLYRSYLDAPRLFGLGALDDQVIAGVIMWVPGSLAFLAPAMVLCVRWLSPPIARDATMVAPPQRTAGTGRLDLLRVPFVGRLFRDGIGPRLLQFGSFAAAVAVVLDGLRGPRQAPMNLAGVVPWTLARGLAVLALLVAGNLFCMACPFALPRALGRWLGRPTRAWPRPLRRKWIAITLLIAFFVAAERFDWWDAPRATALLVLGYFAASFAVEAFASGSSFCKWVCPIGQLQFVGSLVSPLEVKVRLPVVCASCTTHDCLRGNSQQRGCGLDLYLPRKVGNFNCTFCLDCVQACPHDNVGLVATPPGGARLPLLRRLDVAVLALVVVVAAFACAAVMVRVADPARLVLAGLSAVALVVAVALWLLPYEVFCDFALALVPLGVAMWAAHLGWHLVTGWRALVPVAQRLAGRSGVDWSLACAGFPPAGIVTLELLLLDAGLLLSLYWGWRAVRVLPRWLPFASFAAALWAIGVWILLSPMQMRGML